MWYKMYIGQKIKALRKKKNLDVAELAKDLKVHPDTVYKWERDQAQPRREYIKALAEYFCVEEVYFFTTEEQRYKDFSSKEEDKIEPISNITSSHQTQYPPTSNNDVLLKALSSMENTLNIVHQDNMKLRDENETLKAEVNRLKGQIDILTKQISESVVIKNAVNGKAAGE